MPASPRSLRLTDVYRDRLVQLRDRVDQAARQQWGAVTIADLEAAAARWTRDVATLVETAQRAGVRLTSAYLAAYLASELARPPAVPAVPDHAGAAEDGRALADALGVAVIGTRVALKAGHDPAVALEHGISRGARLAAGAVMFAPRAALTEAIRADDRIVGWRRVTGGGCGACLAAATGAIHADSEALPVHDNCRCTTEPVVRGVRERAARPTGRDLFAGMSPSDQERLLGPEKAELIRAGEARLDDLIARSPMATVADRITEAPLSALA